MPRRSEIVTLARAWIGTPWAPVGSRKGVGANCVGFLAGVAHEAGLEGLAETFRPYAGYAVPPQPLTLLLALRRHLQPIGVRQVLPGDLLLFDLGAGLRHVALASGPDTIIHAHQTKGRVVEHRLLWHPHSAYRLVEVDD